ncbi:hypothetical protein ACFOZ0_14870 [Streptomyces yaanensis]|uniref:Core-binding (CB) domain-containing protein n=1 Tax=Streptomyces yaanensis TaxID=1142239 RepID=A0ABV7SC71_9ACTN|nr:hypothetical protein [Streptomyces sp. CGMCC 4.7035]WNB98637.1 hypothetical protein Q2K21_11440 [Streptomyces sp. CGMCC 4.7035]
MTGRLTSAYTSLRVPPEDLLDVLCALVGRPSPLAAPQPVRRVYGQVLQVAGSLPQGALQPGDVSAAMRDGSVTLDDYVTRYWQAGVRGAPGTVKRIDERVRLHIRPHLGTVPLRDITPAVLRGYIAALEGECAPRYARQILTSLWNIFETAIDDKRLVRNPMRAQVGALAEGAVSAHSHHDIRRRGAVDALLSRSARAVTAGWWARHRFSPAALSAASGGRARPREALTRALVGRLLRASPYV